MGRPSFNSCCHIFPSFLKAGSCGLLKLENFFLSLLSWVWQCYGTCTIIQAEISIYLLWCQRKTSACKENYLFDVTIGCERESECFHRERERKRTINSEDTPWKEREREGEKETGLRLHTSLREREWWGNDRLCGWPSPPVRSTQPYLSSQCQTFPQKILRRKRWMTRGAQVDLSFYIRDGWPWKT